MMGMHGEAWVNNAIQEADLLIALGMRFDNRVTGNLKTYAQTPKIHVDIDRRRSTRTFPSTSWIAEGSAVGLTAWTPSSAGARPPGSTHRSASQG